MNRIDRMGRRVAGICAHLSTMQTILSATASPLESRLEIYFNFHRSRICMWIRRIPVWICAWLRLNVNRAGILSVPRDVWLLSAAPSCCRDIITFIIIVAMEFRVFSTQDMNWYVLRLRNWRLATSAMENRKYEFSFICSLLHMVSVAIAPLDGAPLTAASRDMRPNDIRRCVRSHCDCYNLWLWLLKARMMSTSQKINKNDRRTQFVLTLTNILQDGECKHRRARRRRAIQMKNTLQLSARCALRENYGQNESQCKRTYPELLTDVTGIAHTPHTRWMSLKFINEQVRPGWAVMLIDSVLGTDFSIIFWRSENGKKKTK